MKHILLGKTWEDNSLEKFEFIYTLSDKNRFLSIFKTSESEKRYIIQEGKTFTKRSTTWGII